MTVWLGVFDAVRVAEGVTKRHAVFVPVRVGVDVWDAV